MKHAYDKALGHYLMSGDFNESDNLYIVESDLENPDYMIYVNGELSARSDLENYKAEKSKRLSLEHLSQQITDFARKAAQDVDIALAQLEKGYSQRQIKTWSEQRTESEAWLLDNTAAVPLIRGLANRRGISVAEVVAIISKKATAAATLSGIAMGDGQRIEKALEDLRAELQNDITENKIKLLTNQLEDLKYSWRDDWPDKLLQAQ